MTVLGATAYVPRAYYHPRSQCEMGGGHDKLLVKARAVERQDTPLCLACARHIQQVHMRPAIGAS